MECPLPPKRAFDSLDAEQERQVHRLRFSRTIASKLQQDHQLGSLSRLQ